MKKENTSNATQKTTKSTMHAVKRASSKIKYIDDRAVLVSVTHENDSTYQLADKTKVKKEDAVANISKNRHDIIREDDIVRKTYLSHVDCFRNVHELYITVKEIFADATENQYFVFCKEKSIKLRIQKDAVEIMSKELANHEKVDRCANSKDLAKYEYFVNAKSKEEVVTILTSLK